MTFGPPLLVRLTLLVLALFPTPNLQILDILNGFAGLLPFSLAANQPSLLSWLLLRPLYLVYHPLSCGVPLCAYRGSFTLAWMELLLRCPYILSIQPSLTEGGDENIGPMLGFTRTLSTHHLTLYLLLPLCGRSSQTHASFARPLGGRCGAPGC
jgi:hypothetical protein